MRSHFVPRGLTARSRPTRTGGASHLAGRQLPWFVRPCAENIRSQHSIYLKSEMAYALTDRVARK
jgi:hypothetical protein